MIYEINYKLDSKEQAKLKKFQNKIKKKYGLYGDYDYIITPTGIGDVIKVRSHITNETIDITNVDKW